MRHVMTIAALIFLLPSAALAHVGVGPTTGFANGFVHPLSGLDHVLAMTLVGLLAVQIGGRAVLALPAAFIGMMIVGGVLGMAHYPMLFVEAGIALSVLVLGLSVTFSWKPPVAAAVAMTATFALFHGHAHGSEMPLSASGFTYGVGFVVATALLHAAGLALGFVSRTGRIGVFAVRLAGAASSLIGAAFLIAST